MNEEPKPSVGRIVHYKGTAEDKPIPAIIVDVHTETCVSIVKFNCWGAGAPASIQTSVSKGDLETGTSCWNWPPRV